MIDSNKLKKDHIIRGLKLKGCLPHSGSCTYTENSLFSSDSAYLAVMHIICYTGLQVGTLASVFTLKKYDMTHSLFYSAFQYTHPK